MTSTNKHVVFDVVGTLISYDAFFDAIEERLGERFKAKSIGSRIFGYAWMEAGEKEYTYLSVSGNYVVYMDVFRSIFYRTLWQAGIAEPRKFATDEDREFLIQSYWSLKAQPGVLECFSKLHDAGFTIWCLTSGDTKRVSGYLATGGVDFPADNFISCDSIGVGKPSPDCYKYALGKLPKDGLEAWFAAGHMWDASAARRNGFNGAWVSVWEKEPCLDIFESMDVMSDSLPALADGIVAFSAKK